MEIPHNIVGWFEIPATDMDRAIRFYEAVFDVKMTRQTLAQIDMAFFPWIEGGNGSGARLLCHGRGYPKMSGSWRFSSIRKETALRFIHGNKIKQNVRNMKYTHIAILLILTGFLVSGYSPGAPDKNKKYPSFYRENIVVDGNAREWPANSFLTDKEAMLVYSAANDSADFYVCVKIKDEVQQMRVMRSGMDIWINVNGKKKKETGIHFPLSQTLPPSEHRNLTTNGRPDLKKMRMMFLLQVKEMELQGFKAEYNGAVNNKANKSGIVAIINWDSLNTMVYEVRIPFRTLNADISTLDHLSIGMIMKALPKPKPQEEQGQQDNGGIMNSPENGPGMGDRQHGNGMHREGEPFGAGDQNRLYEDVDAWMELGIARK